MKMQANITSDWESSDWTLAVNLIAGQVVRARSQLMPLLAWFRVCMPLPCRHWPG